jgi:phosphohistidine phosphatase
MKDLLLLRHAKSSWGEPSVDDFDRPLNKRGRRAAAAMAKYLEHEGLRPALILCSAARRTRETLDFLLETFGTRVPLHIEPKLYLADAATIFARLRRVAADVPSVLVIGHNPGLQELALELAEAAGRDAEALRERIERKFPTAALARFRLKLGSWGELTADALPGAVKILGFVTPADLPGES